MYGARLDQLDTEALSRAFVAAAERGIEATARATPAEQARLIRARQAPDGSAQKDNAPATRRQKQRTLGHDIPLMGASETLAKASEYTVKKTGRGAWRVDPPSDRIAVVRILKARGYRFLAFGPSSLDTLRKNINRELDANVRKARFVRR